MVACNVAFPGWGFAFELALLGGLVALKIISLNCCFVVKFWLTRAVSRGSSEDGRCGHTSGPWRKRWSLWASVSGRRRGCCSDPEHERRMEPPRPRTPGVNGKIRPWQRISKYMALVAFRDNHTVYSLDLIHVITYIIHGLERK
ncbi:uncharacterized protein LOC123447019 isoform X3 [Hordeum vulgare subsp. vulgare]|uniref:uncharacterized protein LOC123447019 isoform X3 n=1 Tax=Hordeum vulgare subsp. vulgare TaxID=112509 RepID=UPI001D1A599D|nr:uncharacterized protein LOC123447019 isoform X3 [Hordeum vulgare subsp. vulgare]